MKWLTLATQLIDKIPIERLLVKRSENKERLMELADILGESHPKQAETNPSEPEIPHEETAERPQLADLGNQRPKVHLEANPSTTSTVSTKETVDYQNREIGKNLLMLQRHCVQKFRIAGRACDCGQSKHLLELEALAEETAGMVDNPDIYYRVLAWVRRLGPISTVEHVSSGKYDDVYPAFGTEARDLRKELMGTLDPKALFPTKAEEVEEVQEAE
ncbi:MAG: hypothetical protein PHQ43_01550 [Dehalococcoidales bacterium]|nr:hypothetical protein [Dehalococcoidales bacterium]